MTNDTKKTAELAVNSLPSTKLKPTLRERFRDPIRWKKSLKDLALWFVFGAVLTTMLGKYSPGYPIVVGTASITPGLYWLDRQAFAYSTGDFVTFPFKPSQDWLAKRYGTDRLFTKMVKGVAGDTIYADAKQELKICHAKQVIGQKSCEEIGRALTEDSEGRPMTAWVSASHQYTLRDGELWVYAPAVKSLDSRYYGPIKTTAVNGKASPLYLWK